ncbi:hypothetical protein EC912_102691 [Luteibacter rhizovicinus]|uniref:HEPN domain-containing protein n=1 Tax=Luteibacter rhizovicinus TaxID=242606 RepID=A0A4R3YUV2_9GAMM|nr:hypothetical protein [Luteibacter rhizovicinus]TCV96340.1 hypothetical protein EC912_102691 [Luteibacter rhizovicinus]
MILGKWGRTSPFGMLRFAYDYRVAAEVVRASPLLAPASMPSYSLMGQAIELALKSFLRARGIEMPYVRSKVGHDLSRALQEARALSLHRLIQLHDFQMHAIDLLSDPYRGHRFRYIVNGSLTLPNWDFLNLSAHLLIDGLHDFAIRSTFGRDEGRKMLSRRSRYFNAPKQKTP